MSKNSSTAPFGTSAPSPEPQTAGELSAEGLARLLGDRLFASTDERGDNALMRAINAGDEELVRFLGPRTPLGGTDASKRNAISRAASGPNVEILRFLLDLPKKQEKANGLIEHTDVQRRSAVSHAAGRGKEHLAAILDAMDEDLRGEAIDTRDNMGQSVSDHAIAANEAGALRLLMETAKRAGIQLSSGSQPSLLQQAAFADSVECVEGILQFAREGGPDSNALRQDALEALMTGASKSAGAMRLLLPFGDPAECRDAANNTLLMRAAASGNAAAVRELLPLSDLNAQGLGSCTALVQATKSGGPSSVREFSAYFKAIEGSEAAGRWNSAEDWLAASREALANIALAWTADQIQRAVACLRITAPHSSLREPLPHENGHTLLTRALSLGRDGREAVDIVLPLDPSAWGIPGENGATAFSWACEGGHWDAAVKIGVALAERGELPASELQEHFPRDGRDGKPNLLAPVAAAQEAWGLRETMAAAAKEDTSSPAARSSTPAKRV